MGDKLRKALLSLVLTKKADFFIDDFGNSVYPSGIRDMVKNCL
jgi:hypothetical protein